MLRNLGFVWFWKHKDSFCSLNDSLKSLKSVSGSLPRHIWKFLPSLLIILLLKSLYGALGRDEYCEAHLPCICCRVKSWTSLEESVILLDQNNASVWNFWWNCTPPFHMISLAFYLEIWLAYIFFYEPTCAHHFFLYFGAFMCPYFFWRPSCVSSFFSMLCIALSVSFTMLGGSHL